MGRKFLWNNSIIKKVTLCETYGEWEADQLCIDSRKIKKGDIFISIKGQNVDGHDYIQQAFDGGAHAAIVEYIPRNIDKSVKENLILVASSIKALNDLALFNRKRTNAKIIAITGSIGKTSTKEALHKALSAIGDAYCNPGNYNNNLGLPISLASMPLDAEYGIFELGMNHSGEIAQLTKILKPDIAIITNIAAVHLENFDSIIDIAKAKAEIFLGLPPEQGIVLLNGDNKFCNLLIDEAKSLSIRSIYTFGHSNTNNSFFTNHERNVDHTCVTAFVMGQVVNYKIKAYGEHQIINSLVALSTVKLLGLDIEKALKGIENFTNIKGRGKVTQITFDGKAIILIDDSYNASPNSVKAALNSLQYIDTSQAKRKLAILADMYELGANEIEMHKNLLADIQNSNIDQVITVGNLMKHLFEGLPDNLRLFHFNSYEEVIKNISNIILNKDCILIKGSSGTKIHKLVNYLEKQK